MYHSELKPVHTVESNKGITRLSMVRRCHATLNTPPFWYNLSSTSNCHNQYMYMKCEINAYSFTRSRSQNLKS